jgi:hypothetical protein
MGDPIQHLEVKSDADLLRTAATRLSLILSSHICVEHGDHCSERERSEAVIAEIFRRYPSLRSRPALDASLHLPMRHPPPKNGGRVRF